MSSLGGWRVLLHYLLRPGAAAPEAWDQIIKKVEQAISIRLSQEVKEADVNNTDVVKHASAAPQPHERDNTVEQRARAAETSTDKRLESPPGGLSVGSGAGELTVQGLLHGLKLKKDLHLGKVSRPDWKDHKPIVTKSSIHARTAYVIDALARGEGAACLGKRARDFIAHVTHYPEARDLAIKALALVGWCGPPRGRAPAVLALDGGGIRGLIAIEVLRHLERITQRPVNELFDYVIGVSTGAIIAAVIGGGVGDLETASKLYHTLSKEMFGNTSLIGGTSRLVWSHAYYDTAAWEKMLQDHLGDAMLTHCNRKRNPKMALVSCVVDPDGKRLSPFLFRTYSCGFRVRSALRGTTRAPLWHAVRASAAAPAYFQEFHRGRLLHQDGGLMVNNPAGVGLGEARRLWGAACARGTLVSLGTGHAAPPPRSRLHAHAAPAPTNNKGTSWKDKFNTILDSATDTEGVHLMLNDLMPSGSYYRFNPPLMETCAMDEIDPNKIQNMITDTHAYIRRNQHKFEQVAARLTRPRSLLQRAHDSLQRQALLYGLTHTH